MEKQNCLRCGLSGAAAGLVNGLFGAGGGMVLVPMLIRFAKIEDKQAFSSAISIILPITLVTIFVYWTRQIFPFSESIPFLIGGLGGGLLDGILFRKVTPRLLHRLFGLIIIWGGFRLLWS